MSLQRSLAITLVVGLATLTGCGGGFADESVGTIKKAAISDMKTLESVRLAGSIEQDGGELDLDVQLNKSGECTGTIGQDGGTAEFISVDGASYLKGDEKFWVTSTGSEESAQQVLDLLGDKWALVPSSEGGFSEICDLDELLTELDEDKAKSEEKCEETDVDGEEAVEITSEDEDGGTTRAFVATDEPHYILKVETKGGDEPGSFTFSDFDEKLDLEAPAEEDVVDLQAAASEG